MRLWLKFLKLKNVKTFFIICLFLPGQHHKTKPRFTNLFIYSYLNFLKSFDVGLFSDILHPPTTAWISVMRPWKVWCTVKEKIFTCNTYLPFMGNAYTYKERNLFFQQCFAFVDKGCLKRNLRLGANSFCMRRPLLRLDVCKSNLEVTKSVSACEMVENPPSISMLLNRRLFRENSLFDPEESKPLFKNKKTFPF